MAGPEPEVVLQNPGGYPEAREPELARWLEALVAELAPEADSLAVRFASDREVRRLHRTWPRLPDRRALPGRRAPTAGTWGTW